MKKKNNNMGNITPEIIAINNDIDQIINDFFPKSNDPYKKSKAKGAAFDYLCGSYILNLNLFDVSEKKLIDNCIIDNGGDKGIDIIKISEDSDEVSIISCTSFGGHNKKQILKIKEGVEYVFIKDEAEYQNLSNDALKDKINQIRQIANKIKKINIYYCVAGATNIEDRELQEALAGFKSEFAKNNLLTKYKNLSEDINIYLWDGNIIFSKKIRNKNPLSKIKYSIDFSDFLKGCESNGIKGVIATIPGNEIIKMLRKCGDFIFEDNIRVEIGLVKIE
jgi:hypothetical protein